MAHNSVHLSIQTPETQKSINKRKESNQKKKVERINSVESNGRRKKNKETPSIEQRDKSQPELWSKIIGRRDN